MKWLWIAVCLSLVSIAHAAAAATTEIEALLAHVKQLEGAAFIRNGSEHTPVAAEAHLRMKWEKQAAKIKTAEDFIELCATKSSLSSDRYRIRMKDGAVRDSAEVLRERLAELRQAGR
ncbi:MAG: DUF5329 family protein [Opitutae bacterium]|nr:DUF5329 family protein [Opitutae bacterium]